MPVKQAAFAALILLLGCLAAGCTGGEATWVITVNGDGTSAINRSVYDDIAGSAVTIGDVEGVPLEQFLYLYGVYPVTSVAIGTHTYEWPSLASTNIGDLPILVLRDGRIYDGQTFVRVGNVNVTTTERPACTSADIEPSLLFALGLGGNGTLVREQSDRLVLLYVDALGNERYEKARSDGLIDNITSLGEPVRIACVYPSISIVNSKTLVTGIPPDAGQGNFTEKSPAGPTVLGAAAERGLTASWVDGKTSPVNLGNFTVYRPDTSGNGYEADEVTSEAIAMYGNGTNLLFVHYKDTDSAAHYHGPYSAESMAALQYVDAQIGRLLTVLEPGTIVIVYADHGGHNVYDGGDHGTLLPSDMIVPFIAHVV